MKKHRDNYKGGKIKIAGISVNKAFILRHEMQTGPPAQDLLRLVKIKYFYFEIKLNILCL